MSEWAEYHRGLWAQGKPVMAGTASILINMAQLIVLRLIPDPRRLSAFLFWFLLAVTVGSVYRAAYLAWRSQYRQVAACKRETDEIYADIVLDWLMRNHPMRFPASALAEGMNYNLEKVIRGLKVLEKEFKVVRDDGALGWFYDPTRSISLTCQLRRIV